MCHLVDNPLDINLLIRINSLPSSDGKSFADEQDTLERNSASDSHAAHDAEAESWQKRLLAIEAEIEANFWDQVETWEFDDD